MIPLDCILNWEALKIALKILEGNLISLVSKNRYVMGIIIYG